MTGRTALETIADMVGEVTPVLGSLLDSPLASLGISLLSHIFGSNPDDINDLLKKMQSDKNASNKILALTLQHETALKKIAAENFKTSVDDRKSARERQIALKDYVPTILAVGFLFNYAAIQFYCVTHPSAAIDVISARFQDVLIMIMGYYFGSAYGHKPEG